MLKIIIFQRHAFALQLPKIDVSIVASKFNKRDISFLLITLLFSEPFFFFTET